MAAATAAAAATPFAEAGVFPMRKGVAN